MKKPPRGNLQSRDQSFACLCRSLVAYTAILVLFFIPSDLFAQFQSEKTAGDNFGEAQYSVRPVGESIFKVLGGKIFRAVKDPHVAVSGAVKGDTVKIEVRASSGKAGGQADDRQRENSGESRKKGAPVQEEITLERRGGLLTLDHIERKTARGTETIYVEESPDIGFGRTVSLKRGKDVLSGEMDPLTPIVPFQALAVWLAAGDAKKPDAEKGRAIYVVLDTEAIRYVLRRKENKNHAPTWQLVEAANPKDGISITLEYQGENSTGDKIWPALIILDRHGEGARFEKRPEK